MIGNTEMQGAGRPSRWEATLSPALIRTVRALALTRGPISARSLAGSYRTGPTIAALAWLITKGFVESGTSHVTGRRQPSSWGTRSRFDAWADHSDGRQASHT